MNVLRQLGLAAAAALLPAAAFASSDHWIYDADVELYDDFDSDGYFRFLSVRLDADSLRSSAWVYAELWLSADGTTWEHYHSTDDFWIGGETGDDELFIETELLTGYPTGEYDLLIELYDADFGTYSDEFGPLQSDGFALLALEDAEHDPEPVQVTVVDGGGGAMSWLLLPGLLVAGWRLKTGGGAGTPSTLY
jgi:hypothetical protein